MRIYYDINLADHGLARRELHGEEIVKAGRYLIAKTLLEEGAATVGGGEVAGRIQQVAKTIISAHIHQGFVTDLNGTAVTPNDGGAQDILLFIN